MLLEDFPNLLTDCTKALGIVGEQKDPISFLCSLEKSSSKEQIKSKDKRIAATTTMYKKKKKSNKKWFKRSRIPDFGI